ncbi:hypothetical protein RSAG8_03541, partial [Rhizoctonia solani AG-8 WAC10335]
NGVTTAKFPGAYSLDDKGIHVNVFNGKLNYAFPGPAIAKFSAGTSSVKATNNNSTTSDDDETTTSATTTTKSKPTPGSGKGSKSNDRRSIPGWTSRMHKRYLGAVRAPAAVQAQASD